MSASLAEAELLSDMLHGWVKCFLIIHYSNFKAVLGEMHVPGNKIIMVPMNHRGNSPFHLFIALALVSSSHHTLDMNTSAQSLHSKQLG